MSAFDVIVVGEVLIEVSAAQPLAEATDVRLSCSGDALNAAAAAAAAGASVALLTRVGDDELGERIVGAIGAHGVDASLVRRGPEHNGIYFVAADPHGDREFVYVRRGSAASRLAPVDLDAAPLADAGALVVSGITQALSPSCERVVQEAAERVSAAGGAVVYDPNYRRRLTGAAAARRRLAAMAPFAALMTPSCPGDCVPLLGIDDPFAAARACRELGAAAVAVTRGAAGIVLDDGTRVCELPAPPAPRIVDGTGAGDVLAGTMAARLARGDGLEEAAALGLAAASLSVSGQGGTGHLAPQ